MFLNDEDNSSYRKITIKVVSFIKNFYFYKQSKDNYDKNKNG